MQPLAARGGPGPTIPSGHEQILAPTSTISTIVELVDMRFEKNCVLSHIAQFWAAQNVVLEATRQYGAVDLGLTQAQNQINNDNHE
jgi:hypothetical protein